MGGLNALFIMPSILFKTNRRNLDTVAQGHTLPSIREFCQLIVTFCLASFAWIFFRAESITDAFLYIKEIFSLSLFQRPDVISGKVILIVIVFILIEWLGRENKYALEKLTLKWKRPLSWAFYYLIILSILCLTGSEQQFIYFQF